MGLLIICHADDIKGGNKFTVTLRSERGTLIEAGAGALIWTVEAPGEGLHPGKGLIARGRIIESGPATGGRAVTVAITRRIDRGRTVGLETLAAAGAGHDGAGRLHQRFIDYPQPRIWNLSDEDVETLEDLFKGKLLD